MNSVNMRRFSMLLVVVMTLSAAGCAGTRRSSTQTTDAANQYVVAYRDAQAGTSVSGAVHPKRLETMIPSVQGRVVAVRVKEGDTVTKGEPLVKIDARLAENQLAQAESRYRSAVANRKAAALTASAQARAQLEAALQQALAQQVVARANLRNFTDKDTSSQQIANLEEQVKQADASLRSAENNLRGLNEYDTSQMQVETADFAVKQAELNLSMAQTRLAVLEAKDVTEDQLVQLRGQVTQAQSSLHIAELRLQEASRNPAASSESIGVLEEQVTQAQSSLTVAESNLDHAGDTMKASTSDIDLQRLQVRSSEIALQSAEVNYNMAVATANQKKLQAASAEEQVNQAKSALAIAHNNLDSARATTEARPNDRETLQAQVDQAAAAVRLAEVNVAGFADTEQRNALQLETAREQERQALLAWNAQRVSLENYTLTAPWDGTILAVNAEPGDYASPQAALVTIADTSSWHIETYVDEIDVPNVHAGQTALVAIDAYPATQFAGRVAEVGRTLVRTPEGLSSYKLTIELTNPPPAAFDGMSADATIVLSTAAHVLAVPVESILIEGTTRYVMRVTQQTDAIVTGEKTEVTVGLEGEDYVEITSGLKEGDHIIRQPAITTETNNQYPFMGGGQ